MLNSLQPIKPDQDAIIMTKQGQKLLGHKSIKNTVKYTHLVHFKDDESDVATATTVEEAKDLAATGFEYFTTMNDIQIFRKPKMFPKYRY